jgi:predicted nuclease of predicted toxin-antitoxin system
MGLQGTSDAAVWQAARDKGFVLLSTGDDFRNLALVRGAPPKVVVLRIGNALTDAIAARVLDQRRGLETFNAEPAATLLVL